MIYTCRTRKLKQLFNTDYKLRFTSIFWCKMHTSSSAELHWCCYRSCWLLVFCFCFVFIFGFCFVLFLFFCFFDAWNLWSKTWSQQWILKREFLLGRSDRIIMSHLMKLTKSSVKVYTQSVSEKQDTGQGHKLDFIIFEIFEICIFCDF